MHQCLIRFWVVGLCVAVGVWHVWVSECYELELRERWFREVMDFERLDSECYHQLVKNYYFERSMREFKKCLMERKCKDNHETYFSEGERMGRAIETLVNNQIKNSLKNHCKNLILDSSLISLSKFREATQLFTRGEDEVYKFCSSFHHNNTLCKTRIIDLVFQRKVLSFAARSLEIPSPMIEEFMRLSLVGKLGVDHQDEALSLIQSPRIEPNPGAIEILARIENVQNSKAHIWMVGLIAALLIFLTFEWISYKINMDKTMQEERYSVLEKELSSANAKISDLSTNQVDQIVQIQELTTEKNNLENDKLTLQTNLTQCKCQMSKLLDKNNALIIKEQMMIKEHSTKLNEAVDKLKKSHRNQLEEKNETIKRLETNLNKLRQYQDECDRLRLQLKQVEKERDFTASQLKELTIIKSKIDQEKRELREKIKEEEKLLSINSKIQQKIEDLNNLLEIKSIEHETCLKNLEMQSQKITILTVEMEKNKLAFEHQINELSATKETILEELKSCSANLEKIKDTCKQQSCEISELQQALDLSQTQIEERNDKIAELEKEVEKKESELDRVYDLYSKVEQDYIDLKHLHSLCKQEQHKNDPNEINVTTTESHCQSTAELSEALTMSQTLMDVTPSGSLHEKEHSPSASNQHQNNESQRNSKKKKKKNLASKTTSVTSSPQQDSPPKQEKVETTKNHSNNTPTNESTQSELVSSVHLQPIDPSSSTSSEEQLLRASNKMKKRKVQHHSVKKQLFVKTTKQ